MSEWVLGVTVALLAAGLVALTLLTAAGRREQSRTRAELSAAYVVVEDLRERVESLERSPGVPSVEPGPAVVVTGVVADPPPDRRIDGSLFADLVLRESLVRGVSLAHGVRRALAPETRHRIRFMMRQEVKRSRRQRRTDLRAARRHLADLQRAEEDAA